MRDLTPGTGSLLVGRTRLATVLAGAVASDAGGQAALLDLWADRDEVDGWRLRALVGAGSAFLLHTCVLGDATGYPDVGGILPAAHWFTREIGSRTPLRHLGSPGGVAMVHQALSEPLRIAHGPGVFTIPFGPVRSGVVELMLYDVATAGEDMLLVTPRGGLKHRRLEHRLSEVALDRVALVGERIAGVQPIAGALALCHAVESAVGVTVAPEAMAIRAVLGELERVHAHCDLIMRLCDDASLAVGTAQMAMLKERTLRLLLGLTGHRWGRGVVAPGGVAQGLRPAPLLDHIRSFGTDARRVRRLLLATDSFLDRLERTGRLGAREARALGASGPVARGSGLRCDARHERPYGEYRSRRPPLAVASDGDAMARTEVRMAEIRDALRFVFDIASAGDLAAAPLPELVAVEPNALGIGWAENPEGEWLAVVEAGPDGRLAHARFRPASLLNFGCFQRACEGWVTDFAFIEHSFGLSVAGYDR